MAESMAWMHEPVRLSRGRLPWFLRWMLEQALHRMFCTLERGLLLLMELQREGKLELLPVAVESAPRPRGSRYKMKFPPVAPAPEAGAGSAQAALSPEVEAVSADATGVAVTDVAEAGPATGLAPAGAGVRFAVAQPATGLQLAAVGRRRTGRLSPKLDGGSRPFGRCRRSMFCEPASAGWDNCVQIVPVN